MNPEGNAVLVAHLSSSIRGGDSALKSVPGLLKRVIRERAWQAFTTKRGEHVQHRRFTEFVIAEPMRGLGATVELIQDIVKSNTEVFEMLDGVLQNPVGYNVPLDNVQEQAPTGNARSRALRRLRKDDPALHAEVLAGNLSPHAAMVKAGYRPATFTVRDSPEAVAATLRRRWTPEQVADLALLLTRETATERNHHA